MRRNASTVVVLPGPLAALAVSWQAMRDVSRPEGPARTARPQRVAVVAAIEPVQQAVGVLNALGSLPYGPWWPGLDQLIEAARTFYPGQLAGGTAATG
jgi:hypothetical protein